MLSFRMALKALRNRCSRYVSLMLGLSLGFALVLILSGLAGGMEQNVAAAAARHYGGNLFILGHQQTPYYTPVIRDEAALMAALKEAGIDASLIVHRTNFFESAQVFFNGYSVRQKTVTGIDWAVEARTFSGMELIAGGFDGMHGSNGILLSRVTAKQLGTRVGDDVILELDTVTGQRNTATLVVRGIFNDSSIFGAYTSYVDIGLLSRLIGLADGEYTTFGIYLRDPATASRDSARLSTALEKSLPMFAPVETQQDLWGRMAEPWTGVKYAVLTLDGYLSEITDVISALDIGLVLLLVMMLAIIALGIGNTYRVIVHERTREFGTMRALGMQRPGVSRLVLAEALVIGLLCVAAGTLIGFSLLFAAGCIPITQIPGFDIFLKKGRLGWYISPVAYIVDAALVVAAVLVGGLVPAHRASSVEPARALRKDA